MISVSHAAPDASLWDDDLDRAHAFITNFSTLHKRAPKQEATRSPNSMETGYSVGELTLEFNGSPIQGMPGNLEDYIKQRKWGCTCGTCQEGWMSPRMYCRIYHAADHVVTTMIDIHRPEFPRTGVHPDPEDLYPDVPLELHPYVTLEFWTGYTIIVSIIAELLESTKLPLCRTETAVLKLARNKRGVSLFLNKGGKVAHALAGILDMAWEHSSRLGCDGYFEKKIAAENDEYMALPTCKNDLNFELVRERFGLPPDIVHECKYGTDVLSRDVM